MQCPKSLLGVIKPNQYAVATCDTNYSSLVEIASHSPIFPSAGCVRTALHRNDIYWMAVARRPTILRHCPGQCSIEASLDFGNIVCLSLQIKPPQKYVLLQMETLVCHLNFFYAGTLGGCPHLSGLSRRCFGVRCWSALNLLKSAS